MPGVQKELFIFKSLSLRVHMHTRKHMHAHVLGCVRAGTLRNYSVYMWAPGQPLRQNLPSALFETESLGYLCLCHVPGLTLPLYLRVALRS